MSWICYWVLLRRRLFYYIRVFIIIFCVDMSFFCLDIKYICFILLTHPFLSLLSYILTTHIHINIHIINNNTTKQKDSIRRVLWPKLVGINPYYSNNNNNSNVIINQQQQQQRDGSSKDNVGKEKRTDNSGSSKENEENG